MKRYITLFSCTAVIAAAIFFSGSYFKKQFVTVDTHILQPVSAEDLVVCTGTVERTKVRKVYAMPHSVVEDVRVNLGDSVSAGDVLFTVSETESNSHEINTSSAPTKDSMQTYYNLWKDYQSNGQVSPEMEAQLANALQNGNSASSVNSKPNVTHGSKKVSSNSHLIQERAPISGKITEISIVRGEEISSDREALVIADDHDLQIRLQVNESKIHAIHVGQKAKIEGVGFPNKNFSGVVTNISDEAVKQVSAAGQETIVEVLLKVQNPTSDIKPGYSVKADIITSKRANVLVVPYEAVRAEENGNEYVYIMRKNRAIKVPITTGKEFSKGFAVSKGLSAGDEIIMNPDKVSNGTRVLRVNKRRKIK